MADRDEQFGGEEGLLTERADLWCIEDRRTGRRMSVAAFFTEDSALATIKEWRSRHDKGGRPDITAEMLENMRPRRIGHEYDLRGSVERVLAAMSAGDWRAAVWLESGNYIEGGVDPADRRRIVEQVLWHHETEDYKRRMRVDADLIRRGLVPGEEPDAVTEREYNKRQHARPTDHSGRDDGGRAG